MTQDQVAELREKLAKEITDARDSMVAEGDDIIWLFCQLVHWPHERVHPERTMSDPFIRVSAARTALALLERIEKLEAGLRDAIVLIDEFNKQAPSRQFWGIGQSLHAKIATVRATLARALLTKESRILSETPHAE